MGSALVGKKAVRQEEQPPDEGPCHLRSVAAELQGRGLKCNPQPICPRRSRCADDHELLPVQHLLARLNPKLTVTQVATGVHVNGGPTVFWGLVYLEDQPPSTKQMEVALREAGFDFAHNVLVQVSALRKSGGTNPSTST